VDTLFQRLATDPSVGSVLAALGPACIEEFKRIQAEDLRILFLPTTARTEVAVIFAPGSTTGAPAYDFPLSPVLYFFEGGS
jgi:hypothetical protein